MKRSFVRLGRAEAAYWRMVHRFERYIPVDPAVSGKDPGSPNSAPASVLQVVGAVTGWITMPESVRRSG